MKTYEFDGRLKDVPEVTDDQADALFAAGCDDATPVQRLGGLVPWKGDPKELDRWLNDPGEGQWGTVTFDAIPSVFVDANCLEVGAKKKREA